MNWRTGIRWPSFFEGQYASQAWLSVRAKCGVPSSAHDLNSAVLWGSQFCKQGTIRSFLFKLSLAASIYYIWKERNGRVFQQTGREADFVVGQVMEEVKACALSWRKMPKSVDNICLGMAWGLPEFFSNFFW